MSFDKELQEFYAQSKPMLVEDPLRFKAKLHIGEEAYGILKNAGHLELFFSSGSVGWAVASSGVVANTFFGKGILYGLGLTAASTPLGWVVAASVGSAGLAYGIKKAIGGKKSDKVWVIPKYINTPLDQLAIELINLLIPIAIKIGHSDGDFDKKERNLVADYFDSEWGLNRSLVLEFIADIDDRISQFSLNKLAVEFRALSENNKDCNQQEMYVDLINFVEELISIDGVISEVEQQNLSELKLALK